MSGDEREGDEGLEAESTYRLMRRIDEGDEDALEQLCRRYLPRLKRWARGRLPVHARSLVDTDDLVQDVFLRTVGRLGHFDYRRQRALQAYVRVALDNRIRQVLRKSHLMHDGEGRVEELESRSASPLEKAAGQELLDSYERALARLPASVQEAVVARLELGCSWSEVADALGSPTPEAARKKVERAVLRLAREMNREH